MLEQIAYKYSLLSIPAILAINFGLILIGGTIGILRDNSQTEILRAPYYAMFSLLTLLTGIVGFSQIFWIVPALVGGYSWMVHTTLLLAMLISGYFIGIIATARSRDAFGHKWKAFLAFIPFLALWLLLAESRDENSGKKIVSMRLFSGGLGVALGLTMMIGFKIISTYSEQEITRRVEVASAAGAFKDIALVNELAIAASQVVVPQRIDEDTTMVSAFADGKVFTHVYELESSPETIDVEMRLAIAKAACDIPDLTSSIDAGATFRYTFLRKDKTEIGSLDVTKQTCGR